MALNPSTSLVSWLTPMRDGLVFGESFEDPNFAFDNNWLITQGFAVQSSQESVDIALGTNAGSYSMPLANSAIAAALSEMSVPVAAPCMYQSITDNNQNNPMTSVWFYDDLTVASGTPGPYMKLQLANGQYVQIGARNTAAGGTTYYVAGGPTQDTFGTELSVARVLGWNRFTLKHDLITNSGAYPIGGWFPYVANGQGAPGLAGPCLASGIIGSGINVVSDIYLNGDIPGTTNDSFGYWDDCHLNRDTGVTIYCPSTNNRNFYLYTNTAFPWNPSFPGVPGSNSFNFTATPVSPSGQTSFVFINDFTVPSTMWVEVSQADGTSSPNSLEMLLYLQQVQNGDYYQFQEVNTKQVVKTYDDMPNTIMQSNKAPQGQIEAIVTGQQDDVSFLAHKLEGFDMYSNIQQFYQNARYSRPFSFAINSSWAACAPVVAITEGTNVITVGTNLGVTANNIVPNYWYVLGDIYNQYRQYVFVTAVNGNQVTVSQFLNFNVNYSNILTPVFFLRQTTYYPMMMLTDLTKLGLKVASPMIPRFDFADKFTEYVYR